MKTWVTVAFLLGIVCVVLCEKCEKQEDCAEDECCLQRSIISSPKCRKRGVEGRFCFPDAEKNKVNNIYRWICPCQKGLECKAEKKEEDENAIVEKNVKCLKP